jgi:hypothetical protein
MMKPHIHQRPHTCCCSLSALEPADNCPIHGGGDWPPRCEICGQFVQWDKPQEPASKDNE